MTNDYWMGLITGAMIATLVALLTFIFGAWRLGGKLERQELERTRQRTERMRNLERELKLLADQATALEAMVQPHRSRGPRRADPLN